MLHSEKWKSNLNEMKPGGDPWLLRLTMGGSFDGTWGATPSIKIVVPMARADDRARRASSGFALLSAWRSAPDATMRMGLL
jgi:hypothetical protein